MLCDGSIFRHLGGQGIVLTVKDDVEGGGRHSIRRQIGASVQTKPMQCQLIANGLLQIKEKKAKSKVCCTMQ